MEKLRVAIIGCGRIFPAHYEAICKLDNVELIACCDKDEKTAKSIEEITGVKCYLDYKEMVDKERLDAVHICLPHYLHTEVSCYMMERGINVLCEKPMSINYEDAVHAVDVSKKTGMLYGIIFQCRYNKAPAFVKDLIVSGKVGKVLSARSVLTWLKTEDYYSESDWKGTWDKEGGGVVINQCIHTIDLVNYIIDSDFTEVQCSMHRRKFTSIEVEDTAEGLVKYKNGATYLFYCSNNYGISEPIEIRILCEKCKITLSYNEAKVMYNDGTVEYVDDRTELHTKYYQPCYWGSSHVTEINQFYKACRKEEELEMTGERILSTQKLICEIYKKGKESLGIN